MQFFPNFLSNIFASTSRKQAKSSASQRHEFHCECFIHELFRIDIYKQSNVERNNYSFLFLTLRDENHRLQDLHVGFIAIGAGMGVLALLILLIGCLSTGSTRTFVYKDWKARAGGRFTCIFLMSVTYVLKVRLINIFMFFFSA